MNVTAKPPSSLAGETFTVIVNWNLRDDTLACVRSLFAAGAPAGQVIVVDNGSDDGSPAALRAAFGGSVLLIEAGENLGLSGGINLGAAEALARGAGWVFILNNDTLIDPALFEQLGAAIWEHPGVAGWGPRIMYHADPGRIWFLGEQRVGGTLLGRRVNELDTVDPALEESFEVDFLSGCAMLVRRDVFEAVGGFDPTFFLFAEEVDFCLRAARAGFRLGVAPRARVLHKVSLSTDRDRPRSRFYRIRNQIWFYRRYAGFLQRAFLLLFTAFRSLRLGLQDHPGPTLRGWFSGWFAPRRRFMNPRTDLPGSGAILPLDESPSAP